MDKISLFPILSSAVTNALGSTIMKHAYGGDSGMVSAGWIGTFLKILLNPWIIIGLGMFGISFFFMAAAHGVFYQRVCGCHLGANDTGS